MRVLAFVSDRPGCGKTLLAGHVAAQAEADGAGPVVLLDGDPAGDLSRWWQAYGRASPLVGPWDHSCTAAGFARLGAAGVGLVVVDTSSGDPAPAQAAIALADLVVIPTRPNPRDLELAGAVVDTVEARGAPFVFLINHNGDEDEFPTAAVIALAQHGTVCPVILPHRAELARCQGESGSVADLDPDSPAGEDIARLWDYLAAHMARIASSARAKRGHPGPPAERRRHPRHRYAQSATFTADGMVFPCRINDISAGGISIGTDEPPARGTSVVLHVPYLGEFAAEPVYAAGERVGLRFLIDEARQGELVARLSALIRAERAAPAAQEEAERAGQTEAPPRRGPKAPPRAATG